MGTSLAGRWVAFDGSWSRKGPPSPMVWVPGTQRKRTWESYKWTQDNCKTQAGTAGLAAGSGLSQRRQMDICHEERWQAPIPYNDNCPFRDSASSCAQLKTFPRRTSQSRLLLQRP